MIDWLRKRKADSSPLDVVVVGGGAAGIGVGVALKDAGLENFAILERFRVGSSFSLWPDETQFITPSFPTNSIGMLDLNAVALGVSPAFSLKTEHPTGKDFARHLQDIVAHCELPLQEQTNVLGVTKVDGEFRIEIESATDTESEKQCIRAKNVVWAAGEYQYPRLDGIHGSKHCRHTATIDRYADLDGDDFVIIGGYESGIDAAFHLASRGKRVTLLDSACPWESSTADPSIALSPFSLQRMNDDRFKALVSLHPNCEASVINRVKGAYDVIATNGHSFKTPIAPLLATGFVGSHPLVAELFDARDDGFPLLNENDESTRVPGMFLCGPAVRHDNHIFCFIYKYRQRFAVVAKAIATSLGLPAEQLELYRNWGMYLDDLSCCGEECVC
ncbi:MAG: NAD(P)/FAD-dependent oxidoreductase [Planctomycetota bacterium]